MYLLMVVCFAAAPVISSPPVALSFGGMFQAVFAVMQATLGLQVGPVAMRARLLGVLSVCIGTGRSLSLPGVFSPRCFHAAYRPMALAAQGLLVMLLTRRYWGGVLKL
jgi:hypothetical protein